MNLSKLLEAHELDDREFLELLADVLCAWEGDPIHLHDDLHNETRLYEALGKEDARTVLAHHRARIVAKALIRMRLDGKDPEMPWDTQDRVHSYMDAMLEHTERRRRERKAEKK